MISVKLFRALFPKWNFFENIAYTFELHFKLVEDSEWKSLLFLQSRKTSGLFYNSHLNEALAQTSVIEHFAQDIQELQKLNKAVLFNEVQTLTSFKLIRSLLELRNDCDQFQFKIVASSPFEFLDIYISDWIARESE